jgi:DNA repair exonuclease SbcCD nuclease subunit
MTKPYLLFSDVHAHAWSHFSSVDSTTGMNSRLIIILNELERAFDALHDAEGDLAVFAGDLFHTRGQLDPEVFNPVFALFERMALRGFRIVMIPGNHDLKGKETSELGNAFQAIESLNGVTVITEPLGFIYGDHRLALVPWISKMDTLKGVLENLKVADKAKVDVICHGGIDGTLSGMPAHGLSPEYLAKLGFNRVFSGHYHHHKDFGNGVYSIGATTHQTFSDIGTLAGFCLVHPDKVEFCGSHAPRFISVDEKTDMADLPIIVPGNYVRVRGLKLTDTEIAELRKELTNLGAAGVSIEVPRAVVAARPASGTASVLTINQSVHKFIDDLKIAGAADVKAECDDILTTVLSMA